MKHITVCICTLKRPDLLKRLLNELDLQCTDDLFTYSIVVVDNDRFQTARQVVLTFQQSTKLDIKYFIEPVQNISLARNRAIENARGDLIVFIDDDEFPVKSWLLELYKAFKNYGADGVLGPVRPYFEQESPAWIIKGKFCERKEHATETVLHWGKMMEGQNDEGAK